MGYNRTGKSSAAAAAGHVGRRDRTVRDVTRRIHDDRTPAAIPVPGIIEAVIVTHATVEVDAAAAAVVAVGFAAGAQREQDREAEQLEMVGLHFASSCATGMLTIPI